MKHLALVAALICAAAPALAAEHITPELRKQCVDAFINDADDPGSVQMAGPWEKESELSGGFLGIIRDIRAKNRRGALVKGYLMCLYKRHGGRLVLDTYEVKSY